MMSKELIKTKFERKSKHLWHKTNVYCLVFDRTGSFVFTGGDDGIVKIYSISKDILVKCLSDSNENEFNEEVETVCQSMGVTVESMATLESKLERFAVCDLAVNYENTLIAAAKHNGSIPIWNLQTYQLVIRLEEQMFAIRSIKFTPMTFNKSKRYLISTSLDGFIFCYVYDENTLTFESNSLHRKGKYDAERAINLCCDSSSGGLLLGVIHTFGVKTEVSRPKSKKEPTTEETPVQSAIRIFSLSDESGPREEWKYISNKKHSECEYSFRFAHNSFRFASGCDSDSNVFIWTFDKANKKWESIFIDVNNKADKKTLRGKPKQTLDSLFIYEIIFSREDKYLITHLTDNTIKVWNSESGELVQHFKEHNDKLVMECHPIYDNVFMSAGYDSKIIIYDIPSGTVLRQFECNLEVPQIDSNLEPMNTFVSLKPMLLQCSFSPSGQTIAATDNLGNMTIYSSESQNENNCLDQLEEELFRIHAEEEAADDSAVPMIKRSEKELNFFKSIHGFEVDLLKGIERTSPLKAIQLPSNEETKTVRKLDFDKQIETKTNEVKKTPVSATKKKGVKKFNAPLKHKTETTAKVAIDVKPKTTDQLNTSVSPVKGNYKKENFVKILDKVFDNPNSLPFQQIDHILYPDYRKEISDADICLSTIRVELTESKGYRFTKFNRDMNTVIENAKTFYKERVEASEIYEMAVDLEQYYCKLMNEEFGVSFKPPKPIIPSSDEDSDEDNKKPSTSKFVTKQNKVKSIESQKKKCDKKVIKSTPLRAKSTRNKTNDSKDNKSETTEQIKVDSNSTALLNEETVQQSPVPKANGSNSKRPIKRISALNSKTNIKKSKTTANPNNSKDPESFGESNSHIEVIDDIVDKTKNSENNNSNSYNFNEFIDGFNGENNESIKRVSVIMPSEEMEVNIESQVNGSNSCDNEKQTPNMKNCLFCVFCDQIFETRSEATGHYRMHLCPLKCTECDTSFEFYETYASHLCANPNPTGAKSVESCRWHNDSINWIDKFLNFQTTDDIIKMKAITDWSNKCIVCQKVQKFRPEYSNDLNTEFESHLEKHLKYKQQYQCLICILDEDKYFYCNDSVEAEKHMKKQHKTYDFKSKPLQHFDPSIPLLDQIFQSFYSS